LLGAIGGPVLKHAVATVRDATESRALFRAVADAVRAWADGEHVGDVGQGLDFATGVIERYGASGDDMARCGYIATRIAAEVMQNASRGEARRRHEAGALDWPTEESLLAVAAQAVHTVYGVLVAQVRDQEPVVLPALRVMLGQLEKVVLDAGEIQDGVAKLGVELRQLREALPALVDLLGRADEHARRKEWFEFHVVPAHATLAAIYDDYVAGFSAAADACRSGIGIEDAIALIEGLRRRRSTSRAEIRARIRELGEHKDGRTDAGEAMAAALAEWLAAAQGLLYADLDRLNSRNSWYSYYVEQFADLRARGDDPLDRSRYAIAGDHDLTGPMAVVLRQVVREDFPRRYEQYSTAFAVLRMRIVPG
jgi:hypothetical protein